MNFHRLVVFKVGERRDGGAWGLEIMPRCCRNQRRRYFFFLPSSLAVILAFRTHALSLSSATNHLVLVFVGVT